MQRFQKNSTDLFLHFSFYLLLILIHGYTFGTNDQMDFMPYARHLQDPALYVHDFYISCLGSRLNERWLLAHLISFLPHGYWPILFQIIHCFFTLLLIHGLKKWAELFIELEWIQWTCLFLCLMVFYHRNLGGNELYYNMVCASLIAKSIAAWALYCAFKSDWAKAAVLTIGSTYFHPIVGVHILILSCIIISREHKFKYILFSFAGISPYVFNLINDLNNAIPSEQLVSIMRLRNAHHFFPDAFGILNYSLLVPLYIIGTFTFYKVNPRIFYLMLFIMIGCIGYTLGMLIAPEYMIMTQWFKATIWLKFFSIIGILWRLSELPVNTTYFSKERMPLVVLFVFVLFFVSFKCYRNLNYPGSLYQFPWTTESNEIKTALLAKNQSQPDAVFLVPADYTAFKYFSARSTYVDWKAIPHNGECLKAWSNRIFTAYGISDTTKASLAEIYFQSNQYLSELKPDQKVQLKSEGIDYIIFRKQTEKEYVIEAL